MQRGLKSRLLHLGCIDHLITSRLTKWRDGVTTMELPELDEDDAVSLLAREAGLEESAALRTLAVETLERRPLALMIAGADLANGFPLETYAEAFQERLHEIPPDVAYPRSLAAAILGSVDRLPEDARAFLDMAAFMAPEDIAPDYLPLGVAALQLSLIHI